ncbi:MAG TPA: isochorismatase family protein [Thermomicrobiales bacterium]|jgi:nicotinamidase-related amidase
MARLTTQPDDLAILVIDVQPSFLDGWMAGASEPLLARLEYLLGLATAYDLPCVATFEQPVAKKGWLPDRLEPFFPGHGQRFTKNTFNCCGEDEIAAGLARLGRSQFTVAGGETDVCVLQSVLGLIEAGYRVFLLEDCLFSSEPQVGPAIRRMEQAGAVPSTVKTLSYELRRSVASASAKDVLADRCPGLRMAEPEELPVWEAPT